jgi:hypothetical protein
MEVIRVAKLSAVFRRLSSETFDVIFCWMVQSVVITASWG